MTAGLSLIVAVSLTAEPARLQAGDGSMPVLRMDAPEGSTVTFWTSTGAVSPAVPAGPGRWTARYTATRETFPRVALVLATAALPDGRRERAWLAIPIDGRDAIALVTKPSSRVEVRIGNRVFGPVRSDTAGHAHVKVVVPPGLQTASVVVQDKFGNQTETPVDLRPPPFQRLRLLAADQPASWADPAPAALELFAVDPSGAPARRADLVLSADRGQLGAVVERAPGVFVLPFRAPDRVDAPQAQVEAKLFGDLVGERVAVTLRPGPPARIELRASSPSVAPDRMVRIDGAVFDGRGNALPEAPIHFDADAGSVTAAGPRSCELRISGGYAGREAVHVVARAGAASAELSVALASGAPAALQIRFAAREAREGELVDATVEVNDAAGNPVRGAALQLAARGASFQPARELGRGRYAVALRVLPASAPAAELQVGAGATQASARLPVVAGEQPWGLSVGGWLVAQHNLSKAGSGGLELEVAAHPGRPWLEVLARCQGLQFAPVRTPLDAGATQRTSLHGLGALAGARLLFPLHGAWSLQASAEAGALRVMGSLRIQGGPADGVSQATARWVPTFSAGAGGNLRLGPGRLLAEAQLAASPSSNTVQGNLGGLRLRAGWLMDLR